MKLEDWLEQVPEDITQDPLWKFDIYRQSLFLADLAGRDCEKMMRDERGRVVGNQLIRSVGLIAANIEEGYSRGYGKDYARFLRTALGSARESRGWYYRGRTLLEESVINHRYTVLNKIISGLVQTSAQQKSYRE